MTRERARLGTLLIILMLVAACSSQPGPVEETEPAPDPVVPEASPQPAPATVQDPTIPPPVKAASPERAPSTSPPPPPAEVTSPPPSPSQQPELPAVDRPEPDPPTPAATPIPTPTPLVADVGGLVEMAATKPGLSRVGVDKCRLCHKLQFASWSESAHAGREPPLDCESCHGPGSEYKALAVMKDPAKARSAGLVIPGRSFCSNCHTAAGWTDDLLKRTHAHKDEQPGAS